jgi:hypothetical protein
MEAILCYQYTAPMKKADPEWLAPARALCSEAHIRIMAWGPEMLTVEARSPQRAKEISLQLARLGFEPIDSEDDVQAGMLSLSKNPDAVTSHIASFNISRRSWQEQIEPLIWAAAATGVLLSKFGGADHYPSWFMTLLADGLILLFLCDGIRIWGWRLYIVSDGLRIRRGFRWHTIPWIDIRTVDSAPTRWRNQEIVVVRLTSQGSKRLGMFSTPFARNLRDRLRLEVVHRQDGK